MAGRYRALLIGNSSYPADEHNLQTLKGPVKDIAVLNRALIDPGAGLFHAAADHDGDGYITFSDLYAYVDRRLRDAGKQVPQRRVVGDGDVRLAKREPASGQPTGQPASPPTGQPASPPTGQPASPPTGQPASPLTATMPPAGDTTTRTGQPARPPAGTNTRRKVLVAAVVAAVAIAGGVIAAVVLLPGGSGQNPGTGGSGQNPGTSGHSYTGPNTYTASAPWRLKLADEGYGNGCSLTLIDANSGAQTQLGEGIYDTSTFQISNAGTFRWRVNDPRCHVVALPGTGTEALPFAIDQSDPGDTGVFTAPAKVAVHVKNWHGNSSCDFRLYDPATGTEIDFATATQGQNGDVTLDSSGRKTVYLHLEHCGVGVSAAR